MKKNILKTVATHFLFFLNFVLNSYTLTLFGDFFFGDFYLLGLPGIEFSLPFDFFNTPDPGLLN
jgi:hypothetical protein